MYTRDKKGVTILALVLTIVVMLLLAAVVIQITMGENGLVIRAMSAKQEQKKEELFERIKVDFLSEKVENASNITTEDDETILRRMLSDSYFLPEYRLSGEDIYDKEDVYIGNREEIIQRLKGNSTENNTNNNNNNNGGNTNVITTSIGDYIEYEPEVPAEIARLAEGDEGLLVDLWEREAIKNIFRSR